MVHELLQELVILADEFLETYVDEDAGDDRAVGAVQAYLLSRTAIYEQIRAAGGPAQSDRELVVTLLERDARVRERLTASAQGVRTQMDKLRNGRRALRGYRAEAGAGRPMAVKG